MIMLTYYEKVIHNKWIESNYEQECIVRNMTHIFLQEIISNILRKIFKDSEGFLIEVVSWLIDAIM